MCKDCFTSLCPSSPSLSVTGRRKGRERRPKPGIIIATCFNQEGPSQEAQRRNPDADTKGNGRVNRLNKDGRRDQDQGEQEIEEKGRKREKERWKGIQNKENERKVSKKKREK